MIFVTGANGFVGKHLCFELEKRKLPFIAGTRKIYGEIDQQDKWQDLFKGVSCIVHLAARVHIMDEKDENPLEAFRKINVEATMNMARAARSAGVKQFIYVSSVKVNGEQTGDVPFTAADRPHPEDPYGISKMEAEIALLKLHETGVFDVVIIRPPLIYGPGVKANFEKLFWLVKKDLPLPFGRVHNKRSLVSVFNLCDLIIHCIGHGSAGGETFLVSDDHDYSLKEMVLQMGKTLGKSPHILPVPLAWMKCGLHFLGKDAYAERLLGNLHVDIEKTKTLLSWKPKFTFEETFKNN